MLLIFIQLLNMRKQQLISESCYSLFAKLILGEKIMPLRYRVDDAWEIIGCIKYEKHFKAIVLG